MAGKDRQTIFWGCMCLVAAFVLAGGRAPLVNEAHYLTKARHFWDSSWCPDDPFLRSADAHWGFYLTCGWLTQCTSLAISAYGLRFVAWGLLASGWVRLCRPLGLDGWRSFLAWLATLWLVDHGHLAGEWLIGGAEGKPFAYGFVFWALSFRAEGRWGATWIALGLAIWFHPVVGGWCTLGFVAVSLLDVGMVGHLRVPAPSRDPDARTDGSGGWPPWPTCGAALACLLAAAAIWPIFQAQSTVDRATATEAAVIQVYHRLPHHLLLHAMRPWHRWRFAMSVVVWLAAAWSWRRNPSQRMIHRFVGWTVILTVVGCLVDVATWNQPSAGAPLLKFYWFRLSDIFVPVGIGCSLAGWLQRAESRWSSGISAALLLCLVSWIAYEFGVRQTDSRPAADQQGDFGLRGARRTERVVMRIGVSCADGRRHVRVTTRCS